MKMKVVLILSICAAVIAGSVAAIVVSVKRADAARAEAERAASKEMEASRLARVAEAERQTEAAKAREAEAAKARADADLAKAEAEEESQRLEAENLAAKEKIAEAERAAAEAEAKKAADQKAAKELERKIERDKADAEAAKAAAAADERAKAEAQKASREAEALKLKVSMAELEAERLRYEELNAELLEYQKELDERERALRPEKTVADLSWLPDEDTKVDENGRARPKKKVRRLPENDPELPAGSRRLAKAERLRAEADAALLKSGRDRAISRLEALYVAALKEDHVVDAAYYRQAIKAMYPDWVFTAPEEGKKEEGEARP